jgi:hypothetical protein
MSSAPRDPASQSLPRDIPAGRSRLPEVRTFAGACGRSAYRRHDGENSVSLTSASGERGTPVPTSVSTWSLVATSLPSWCVASQARGPAWPSEPARLEPARRRGAVRLAGGARAPREPRTRRHRHMPQSLRARPPTPLGGEQARESTRRCRFPKRAQREGHPHRPWRLPGPPDLPSQSARAAQHPPARGLRPQPAGMRTGPALRSDARPPGQVPA